MQKFSIVQIFVVFIFACRTCMQNMQKIAPYENFPLYGICNEQLLCYLYQAEARLLSGCRLWRAFSIVTPCTYTGTQHIFDNPYIIYPHMWHIP